MCIDRTPIWPRPQHGLTLIELVIFIVIVSVALAGVLTVLNITTQHSADPMIRKQMLAIAESLLEEVQMKPFTFCDLTDTTAATATNATVAAGNCTTTVEAMGPEGAESRINATTPFNNVNDYYVAGGLALASPIVDITSLSTAPAGYSARIDIAPETLNGIASAACASGTDCTDLNALRITVTVTHGSDSLVLDSYRTRYQPNF